MSPTQFLIQTGLRNDERARSKQLLLISNI